MAATNRTDKIKQLFKLLQKRYKHVPKHAERGLLECLMFAACLENASFDAAESAYSVLEHHYIDWNELRVSTPQEIGDTLQMLPKPVEAGERIKKTLQWIFETTYMFDLEDYRKKTIGQMVEYLDSIPSCTAFMTNYLVQIGLGGHQIPLDEGSLRIMRQLDLTKVIDGKEEVSGLDRAIIKSKGIEFATLIHTLGVDFFDKQDDAELLTLLKSIDKNAPDRTWQEPEGLQKKTNVKLPVISRASLPVAKVFQPEIELDDEEEEVVGSEHPEEAIEFIDTSLAALGNGGGKETGENGTLGVSKAKKTSIETKTAKTKIDVVTEKSEVKQTKELAAKADAAKKDKPAVKITQESADEKSVDENSDDEKKSAKKANEKSSTTDKNAQKKSAVTKKAAPKKETKKLKPKTEQKSAKTNPAEETRKKTPKKSEPKESRKKTADNRSATKKLQQKKPR